MVKKYFLLPDEAFVSEDPFLIGSVVGGLYVGLVLHCAKRTCGGAVSFSIAAVEGGGLLDEGGNQQVIERCLARFKDLGIGCADLAATLVGARSDAGGLKPGEFDFNLERIAGMLRQAGIAEFRREINDAPGAKLYFKNWDNSLRVLPEALPAFCRADKSRKEGRIKILIVDDSSLVQNILTRTLGQDPGFKIVGAASDAFAATEAILEADPDVLILDVIMPQINGISFLTNLMYYLPKPVIIFSTMGKTGGQIEKQAFDAGAVDVVDKKSLNLSDARSIEIIKDKVRAASKFMVMKKEKA
ncbi:MAG: response regulator [Planctomycetota bacterium]